MNCPKCQAALQPGLQSCPSCNAAFSAPVAENAPITLADDVKQADTEVDPASLLVQQVTNVTGVPASVIPKWRHFKPVALVGFLAPLGLVILIGVLLTGDVYKPEQNTEFYQPLSPDEKIKLAAAAAVVQTILFVLILSV